jgi:hypothetical protein
MTPRSFRPPRGLRSWSPGLDRVSAGWLPRRVEARFVTLVDITWKPTPDEAIIPPEHGMSRTLASAARRSDPGTIQENGFGRVNPIRVHHQDTTAGLILAAAGETTESPSGCCLLLSVPA